MLKLLSKHTAVIDKGCSCEEFNNSPCIAIRNIIEDWIVYDPKNNKVVDVTTDGHGRISVIQCAWCDKVLGKWKINV